MFSLKNVTMLTRAQQKNIKGGDAYPYAFCSPGANPCPRPNSYCKDDICYQIYIPGGGGSGDGHTPPGGLDDGGRP